MIIYDHVLDFLLLFLIIYCTPFFIFISFTACLYRDTIQYPDLQLALCEETKT